MQGSCSETPEIGKWSHELHKGLVFFCCLILTQTMVLPVLFDGSPNRCLSGTGYDHSLFQNLLLSGQMIDDVNIHEAN